MKKKQCEPADRFAGAKVRERRVMLGMSQGELADVVGLTFQQIQKYEKGANRMGASRLVQMAEALTVPISYFFAESLSEIHSDDDLESVIQFTTSNLGMKIIKAFAKLDSGVRAGFVFAIEASAQGGKK